MCKLGVSRNKQVRGKCAYQMLRRFDGAKINAKC